MFSDSAAANEDDILSQNLHVWRGRQYTGLLDETLLHKKSEMRILQLTEGGKDWMKRTPEQLCRGWPCAPRKRPVIEQPELVFDLPGYEMNMHYDVLDWSSGDLLIVALGSKIFMWHSPSNNIINAHTFEDDNVTVAKWDPSGKYIAVGTFYGFLYYYDFQVDKMRLVPWKIFTQPEGDVSITALCWGRSGREIACGMSMGAVMICHWHTGKPSLYKKNAHATDVLAVMYSPDERYLVTSGMDCLVRLWTLPDVMPCFEIMYPNPARALAWHPWRGCTLAVGGGMGHRRGLGDGSLSVWNVASQTNVCHRLADIDCAVDALAWNFHSGELVVSYWIDDVWLGNESEERGYSRLLILSGPGKVTDELLLANASRTRALLFNPDGTKIANATSDENLFIWNFFGKSGPMLNMYRRKMKRQQMYRRYLEINEFNNFGIFVR